MARSSAVSRSTGVLSSYSVAAVSIRKRRGSRRWAGRDRARSRPARIVLVAALLLLLAGCVPTRSWGVTFGQSNSSRIRATWAGTADWVELAADRRSTASGCTTVWFDWHKAPGARTTHFDPRAARDCHASGSVYARRKWAVDYDVDRMQKAARCTNSADPPTGSTCAPHPDSQGSVANFAPFSDRSCISWYVRKSNGQDEYEDGGVKDDCNA